MQNNVTTKTAKDQPVGDLTTAWEILNGLINQQPKSKMDLSDEEWKKQIIFTKELTKLADGLVILSNWLVGEEILDVRNKE